MSSHTSSTTINLPTENPFAEPRPRGGRSNGQPIGRQSGRARTRSDDSEDDGVIPLHYGNPFAARDGNGGHSRAIQSVYQPSESDNEEEEEEFEPTPPPFPTRRVDVVGSGRPPLRTSLIHRYRPSVRANLGRSHSNDVKGSDEENSDESRRTIATLPSENPFIKPDVPSLSGRPRPRFTLDQSDDDSDEEFDRSLDAAFLSSTEDLFSSLMKSSDEKPSETPSEKLEDDNELGEKDHKYSEIITVELPSENPFSSRVENGRRTVHRSTESEAQE